MDALFLIVLFSLIAIASVYNGIRQHRIGYWLYQSGTRTEGSILNVNKKSKGRSLNYHPVIQFMLPDDQLIVKELKIGSVINSYQKGRVITVVYDPDDPTDCEIASKWRLVIAPALYVVTGLIFLTLSIYQILFLL